MFFFSTDFFFKTNPDVVRYVYADVGPLPEWPATIVATGTVRTPVLGQKRERKILTRK